MISSGTYIIFRYFD